LGAVLLGMVGLIGLGVLGAVIAVPVASTVEEVNSEVVEQVPARTQVVGIERGVDDIFYPPEPVQHSVQSSWGQVEQVSVLGFRIAVLATGILLLFGIPTLLFIVIRSMRRGRVAAPSDESALVHELAQRAQDLSQRMEALETILLDRSGHYRETVGRS
jgi:phage shock protein B